MNLTVISPPLLLTPPTDYGGMEGRAWALCKGLANRGHTIVLLAKEGSQGLGSPHQTISYEDENELPHVITYGLNNGHSIEEWTDVFLDFSHNKVLSTHRPDLKQICNHQVMSMMGSGLNPVFISHGQKKAKFPNIEGPIIYYGLDLDEYPYYDGPRGGYMLYLGQIIREKRIDWACQVAIASNRPLKVYGPWWGPPEYSEQLREYQRQHPDLIELNDSIGGPAKIEVLQKAYALIHPVGGMGWAEAGAICILESLACGTPIIGSDNGCIPEYLDVEPPVGFVCNSVQDMVGVVDLVRLIRPEDCRKRAEDFTMDRMARAYERLAEEVAGGLRWNI